jgi:[ribosomal protein S5]-alanine N-acetyltransferase
MHLETNRLIIRDFEVADVDALYKIKYDKQVLKYNPTFVKRSATLCDIHDAIQYFISVKGTNKFDKEVYYAIVLKEVNSVIGAITVSKLEYLYEIQIGWMMCEEYTGYGYASEAGREVSDYLLNTFLYDYLVVVMDVDNPASFRTAQKSGFKLFEKRVPYDYFYSKCDVEDFKEVKDHFKKNEQETGSCYYYFRKFNPKTKIKIQFYGDTKYDGRFP